MDTDALIFKTIAFLHGAWGYFLLILLADDDFQKEAIYQRRNPLVGDVIKYLALAGAWSLAASGLLGFASSPLYSPKASVILAWLSIALLFATWPVDVLGGNAQTLACKRCAINFAIRLAAALALTVAYYRGAYA